MPNIIHIGPPIENTMAMRRVLPVSRKGAVLAHINCAYLEDAAEIARSIQHHEELVDALQNMVDKFEADPSSLRSYQSVALFNARAAIAKVRP